MELQVIGDKTTKLTVADEVFQVDFNEPLIHQAVVSFQTNARQGTKAQKNRSAVSGGGAKPWKQKGTGRARAGTIRSPIFRTGGVTFAAQTREYNVKINKKMYRKAIASILSELQRKERLIVVDHFDMDKPSTKSLNAKLKSLNVGRTLLVNAVFDRSLFLSARNLVDVCACYVNEVNPYELVWADHVVITVDALKLLEERLTS